MDVFSDVFAMSILNSQANKGEKAQAGALNHRKKMNNAICDAIKLPPKLAVDKFLELFWNSTTKKAIDQARGGDGTEAQIQHRLLTDEFGCAIADFLYGQLQLHGDDRYGIAADESSALDSFKSAFEHGSIPAQDCLVQWCFDHYHSNSSGPLFLTTDSQYRLGIGLVRKILTKAADQANPTAHYLLGVLNLRKQLENANRQDAVHHLTEAYRLGHSQWQLTFVDASRIYDEAQQLWNQGDLWLYNYHNDAAMVLYNIAAKAGHEAAIERSRELSNSVSAAEQFFSLFGEEKHDRKKDMLNINM